MTEQKIGHKPAWYHIVEKIIEHEIQKECKKANILVPEVYTASGTSEGYLDPQEFHIRRKIIKQYLEEAHQHSNWVKADHWQLLRKRDDIWPMAWMLPKKTVNGKIEDTKISYNLKLKKNKRFCDIMNYLAKKSLNYADSRRLADSMGLVRHMEKNKKTGEVTAHVPCLVRLDRHKAAKHLGISPVALWHFTTECERWAIIKGCGKEGPRGNTVFAMGYWSYYPRRIWFLKNTPAMRRALKEFNTQRGKSRQREKSQIYF